MNDYLCKYHTHLFITETVNRTTPVLFAIARQPRAKLAS